MSFERLSMKKIREILRLRAMDLSNRKIARSLSISHSTVGECLIRARQAGLGLAEAEALDDTALERKLYPPQPCVLDKKLPTPNWQEIHKELRKKGVTLQLLWEEYRLENQGGYSYSRFCELHADWAKTLDLSMRQVHPAGKRTFVDYAGLKVGITNPKTGEINEHPLFLGALGASNLTYAELCREEDLYSWIGAHVRMFEYFGGVTEIVVPDNLKSGVKSPCLYEPDINPTYHRLAEYYGVAVIPARVRRAKDKAKAEVGVQIAERWILAALRKRIFFSIEEANEAIWELLEKLNNRPFKKLPGSRRTLFEEIEKKSLRALPEKPYSYSEHKKAGVNIDYHIEVDGHYYSVPYQLVRKKVDIWISASTIEICFKSRRIALHRRSFKKGGHTTLKEHMPKSHQKYLEWTPNRILNWSKKIGPSVGQLAKKIIESRAHPEQGFRACLGVIRLGKTFGNDRLEAACKRSLKFQSYSYKSVHSILKNGLDRVPVQDPVQQVIPFPQLHQNLRGPEYYNQPDDNEEDRPNA